jgi:hypothetical protein
MATATRFTYNRQELRYLVNGRAVPPAIAKAGAEAVVTQARFAISDLTIKLQQGLIGADEWYAGMKEATKLAHMAQAALARGGFDNMSPADWRKVEGKIYNQWAGVPGKYPGLRRFAEDVERGRYGRAVAATGSTPAQQMSGTLPQRAGMYAESTRGTYENTRTEMHQERGFRYATRIKAAVDSCPTCIEEADKKVPIDEVVPISDSECGSRCNCVIIYDRD